ncbi:MAG: E2F-associated phosphoprotein-domain-containing protein [Benniella sp.]|nr:MAG: E2F-associated phosphoprotein-domain-containing protein [Benniella sp.]
MKGITRGLQASTLEPSSTSTSTSISSPSPSSSSSSGIKTSKKKTKQRPTISDADLLYDPDEDDRDQDWLIQKIADIWTDAILSCPMCMTHLCFDCQQHEFYPHQFRAMFVESCRVLDSEILPSPSPSPSAPSVSTSASTSTSPSTSSSSSTTTTTTTIPQPETSEGTSSALHFKPSEDDDTDAIYHPVICEICNTKVAVVDQDEVYHFFNVIPTPV